MGEDFYLDQLYEDRYTSQHDPLDDECWDGFDEWVGDEDIHDLLDDYDDLEQLMDALLDR